MVGRGGDGGDVGGEGEGWLGTCRGVGWVGVGVKSGVCGGVHGCGGVWGREGGAGRGRVSIWVCEWGGYIYIYIYVWTCGSLPQPPLLLSFDLIDQIPFRWQSPTPLPTLPNPTTSQAIPLTCKLFCCTGHMWQINTRN